MLRTGLVVLELTLRALAAAPIDDSGIAWLREPALSPDGSQVVFTYEDDLWMAPSSGGDARRLTIHDAWDHRARFSPDGRTIAFNSNRYGNDDIWSLSLDGGAPHRLTVCGNTDQLVGYTADGSELLFLRAADLAHYEGRLLWGTPLSGGRARPIMDVVARDVACSPDLKRIVYTRRYADLFRKGYRGSANADLFLYDVERDEHLRLTRNDWQDACPVWDPKEDGVYYVSEEDGAFNLWRLDLATGRKDQLTHFAGDGVRNPAIDAAGDRIVFERGAALYSLRPGGEPERLVFTAFGDFESNPTERLTVTNAASSYAISPDGKEAALCVRGDLVCMRESGGQANNLTNDAANQLEAVWPKGSDKVYFLSDDRGRRDIFAVDVPDAEGSLTRALEWTITRVTDTPEPELAMYPSPDGARLAYTRGLGDIVIRDLATGEERTLVPGWWEPTLSWSPDGRWIAFARGDKEYNSDVWIVPVDGSAAPVNVSCDPADDGGPAWSPDGTMLAFHSYRNDNWDVYMVHLTRQAQLEADRKAAKDTDELEDFVAEEDAPAEKPAEDGDGEDAEDEGDEPPVIVEIEFEEIHRRIRRLTRSEADESWPVFSPDSKKLAYSYAFESARGLWTMDPRGGEAKQLAAGSADSYRWDEKGAGLHYLSGGQLRYVSSSGSTSTKAHSVLIDLDLRAEREQVFEEAWSFLDRTYYDADMHGADWPAVRERYRPLATTVQDSRAFAEVMNTLLGELNSSHTGFSSPGPSLGSSTSGWLGLIFDERAEGPGLPVVSVLRGGPCDEAGVDIRPGDVIVAIEGVPLEDDASLWAPLADTVGRRVRVRRERPGEGAAEVVVRPADWGRVRQLCYEETIRERRAMVREASGGRLAYVHITGMGWDQLQEFERDLYAEAYGKDGLLIDVRDNGGGSTADWLLAMLSIRPHARTVSRGGELGYPQSRRPFYVWSKPVVVLCNENSFSNAEIFAHAVKTLGRGKLVGMPTAGGVISTGGTSFVDGSSMRAPGRGWFIGDTDVDMELHGAVPDILVEITPDDERADRDPQLEAAIQAAMEEIGIP